MTIAKHADQLDGSEPREVAIPILVEALGGRIYALGMRFCGDRGQAEDLVQETFMKAFHNWGQFQGRSKASTWLHTIASRVCQRMHRKRAGEPDHMESIEEMLPLSEAQMAVLPSEEGPLAQQIRRESRECVEAAIAGLPQGFRQPFVLKEIAGFSLEEIATILGIKPETAKTRVHRARLRIRKAMEDVLPKREVPPPIFSRQVCLDLLQTKQDALDAGATFEFPDQVICERCAELFATLDLGHEICQEIATGELPEELLQVVKDRIANES